ncbi:ABC transporter substrate-binding protein [Pantanalinema rosaneae CENA516]|uniref:ABC transporter substrate-binding protein n=1 Tax=Pantanalinema rosaneae TaxID=1620701 RepID=UPI003D6E2BD3
MVFTCWQTIACRPVPHAVTPASSADCRLVEHAAGTTCVPLSIQRLVTLDSMSFEYALSLGLQPIAAPLSQQIPAYLRDRVVGVENIGDGGVPNLERVLALKPDLIIGLDFNQNIYAQASQIAPTLLLQFDHSGLWKEFLHRFSLALDRKAIGQQVMEHYNRRLQTLQRTLKAAVASDQRLPFPPQVSVVRIYPDTINLYFRESFCGTILEDAGLARPEAQRLSGAEAKRQFGNEIQASISMEQVDQADGDVMFVWTSEDTAAANASAQEKLAKLQSAPLWQQLNAIKRDRIYFVPRHWLGAGPLAADAVIDDLFKYLGKQA